MKLRTNKQAAEFSGLPLKLINSVVRQTGDKESLIGVFNNGARYDPAPNFAYYKDTWRCYINNRKEVNELIFALAESLSEDPITMVLTSPYVAGQTPKPPFRPVEPKAPTPPDVATEGVEVLNLEQSKGQFLMARAIFEEADLSRDELINEWGLAPQVMAHDSCTCPAVSIAEADEKRKQAMELYSEAYKAYSLSRYNQEKAKYEKDKEEYEKNLALYKSRCEDYQVTMADRAVDYKLIGECLFGGKLTDAHTTIANALAWFALEEVARAVVIDE